MSEIYNKGVGTNNNMNESEILEKVCNFLQIDMPRLSSQTVADGVREICVAKLCATLGIKCKYNYKNEFFSIYSSIIGEAVSQILNLKLDIAPFELKYVRYNGINFVNHACDLLKSEDLDEAFIDMFNLVDDHKDVLKQIPIK